MNIVAAGVVFLLALFTGVAAYAAIPRFTYESDENDGEGGAHQEPSSAPTLMDVIRERTQSQWLALGVLSWLCAGAAWRLAAAGVALLDLCRHIAVMLSLMAALLIDRKTHKIPNLLVLALLGAGALLLLIEFLGDRAAGFSAHMPGAAGLLCCVVLFYLLARLTKDGIGMGDVKLIAAMGWLLGLATTLFSVLFALLLCSCTAIVLLFRKKKGKDDRIPFGPFLFFGHICMLLLFTV